MANEDLANSLWKFVLLAHTRFLDVVVMDFNVLEFKFPGAPPWIFLPTSYCLFLSRLVKASHSTSQLGYSALEHAQLYTPAVPTYTDGPKSSEGVGCVAAFPDFDVFIFFPLVALIFTPELCAIFLTLYAFCSRIVII